MHERRRRQGHRASQHGTGGLGALLPHEHASAKHRSCGLGAGAAAGAESLEHLARLFQPARGKQHGRPQNAGLGFKQVFAVGDADCTDLITKAQEPQAVLGRGVALEGELTPLRHFVRLDEMRGRAVGLVRVLGELGDRVHRLLPLQHADKPLVVVVQHLDATRTLEAREHERAVRVHLVLVDDQVTLGVIGAHRIEKVLRQVAAIPQER